MGSDTDSVSEGRRAPSISRLIGAVHLAILLVPVVALLGLRLVDTQLVEASERRLIAEAVMVGETYRAELLRAEGRPMSEEPQAPPWATDDRYWPLEPMVNPRDLAPDEPPSARSVPEGARAGAAWTAGQAVTPVLRRAQRVNLAGVRVLDAQGCVVASSGGQIGECLTDHPEVAAALAGRYAAVGRARVSDEPKPSLSSIRRRGTVRLFVAVPVLDRGEVVAVVRTSRTAMNPLEVAWRHRTLLLFALLLCGAGTWAITRFLSRSIAGPVRRITDEARRVAGGGPEAGRLRPPAGRVPAEVAELAEALSQMTERLAGHAAEVADFAATLSHELKTPIASIRGATELLRESWESMSEEQRGRFLDNVDGDAERMQRLVTRLLVLARIRASHEVSEPVDARAELRSLAERSGDRVRADLDQAPGRLAIPLDHLRMAVGNLLDNALEHGGDGPVELVAATTDEGRLRVSVRDRGPGISEGNQDRIFDRFFTTRRDAGGTGLGLSIVRAVAEARGGSVSLETGPDGTEFVLVL